MRASPRGGTQRSLGDRKCQEPVTNSSRGSMRSGSGFITNFQPWGVKTEKLDSWSECTTQPGGGVTGRGLGDEASELVGSAGDETIGGPGWPIVQAPTRSSESTHPEVVLIPRNKTMPWPAR